LHYRDVLRLQTFRRLWLGQAISQLGDSFYFVIFMFMVGKITGSAAMVGFVGAAETLPYLVLSLYGGVVADRIDRRRIMLASDLVSAGVLLAFVAVVFAYHGKPPLATLFVLPFALSTARVFFMPAKSAAIPALVPAENLNAANSLSAATQSAMPMIGLSVSATILAVLYSHSPAVFFGSAVFIDALSFIVSAVFIVGLPPIVPDREHSAAAKPWVDLREGVQYVRSRRTLALQIGLGAIFSLCVSPFFVVYVAANEKWFGGRPNTLAWFEFSFTLGLALSSILVGRLQIRHVGHGFIWGLGAVGLFVFAMGFSKSFWLFLSWNFACGISIPFADIPTTTWRAMTVPDRFRGRVNSLQSMVQIGTAPLGMSLGGFFEQRLGLTSAFCLMGSGMLLACLAGLLDREFRTLTLPIAVDKASASDETARIPVDSSGTCADDEVPCVP
jgi:DHA3 family macrolide efflux protein-like MFS transporter